MKYKKGEKYLVGYAYDVRIAEIEEVFGDSAIIYRFSFGGGRLTFWEKFFCNYMRVTEKLEDFEGRLLDKSPII